jgi:hypothetical protein
MASAEVHPEGGWGEVAQSPDFKLNLIKICSQFIKRFTEQFVWLSAVKGLGYIGSCQLPVANVNRQQT